MAFTIFQICVLLSAVCSLVYSQAAIDPNLGMGNPFGQPFDPNLGAGIGGGIGGAGGIGAGGYPADPSLFAGPMPLPRPNPMQSMLPFMLMRSGDMGPLLMMSMLGGGGMGGGGGMMSNPLLMMSLMNHMM